MVKCKRGESMTNHPEEAGYEILIATDQGIRRQQEYGRVDKCL